MRAMVPQRGGLDNSAILEGTFGFPESSTDAIGQSGAPNGKTAVDGWINLGGGVAAPDGG
jgi:hypothetical protein